MSLASPAYCPDDDAEYAVTEENLCIDRSHRFPNYG